MKISTFEIINNTCCISSQLSQFPSDGVVAEKTQKANTSFPQTNCKNHQDSSSPIFKISLSILSSVHFLSILLSHHFSLNYLIHSVYSIYSLYYAPTQWQFYMWLFDKDTRTLEISLCNTDYLYIKYNTLWCHGLFIFCENVDD